MTQMSDRVPCPRCQGWGHDSTCGLCASSDRGAGIPPELASAYLLVPDAPLDRLGNIARLLGIKPTKDATAFRILAKFRERVLGHV